MKLARTPFDPRDVLAGKHILLTGVTGFLGKVWLSWLLTEVPDVGHVTVIIRPRPGKSPMDRFSEIADTSPCFRPLKQALGNDLADFLRERITVVRGNVEKPSMGMGPAMVERLRGSVDAVIHCAGLTDFEGVPGKMVAVNTLGAAHAAELSRTLGAKHLHVSTCYVAGNVSGRIAEAVTPGVSPNGTDFDVHSEIAALDAATALPHLAGRELKAEQIRVAVDRAKLLGWPNVYTYTKGMAEHLVAGMDHVTIVRPAILECAQSYPFTGWNEGLNTSGPLSWLIATAFRHLPANPDFVFDVVPIDDAAKGLTLALAAALDGRGERVYHIASSDHNPMRFGRCIELNGLAVRKWERQHGQSSWKDLLLRHLDPVAAPDGGPLPVPRVRRLARFIGRVAHELNEDEWLGETARRVEDRMKSTDRSLERIEEMLRVYEPFIRDNDYRFVTSNLRTLTEQLAPEDRNALGYDLTDLDWCHYWVDVEYPGLMQWSIPLIRGEKAPVDPASTPPLRLDAPAPSKVVSL